MPAVCVADALAVPRDFGPLAAGQRLLELHYLQLVCAIADRQVLPRVLGLVGLDAGLAEAIHGQLLLELGRRLLQLHVLRRLLRGRVKRPDLRLLLREWAARAVGVGGNLVLMPRRRVLPRHRVVEQMLLIFAAVARLLAVAERGQLLLLCVVHRRAHHVGRVLAADVRARCVVIALLLMKLEVLLLPPVRRLVMPCVRRCSEAMVILVIVLGRQLCHLEAAAHDSNAQQVHVALQVHPLIVVSVQRFSHKLVPADDRLVLGKEVSGWDTSTLVAASLLLPLLLDLLLKCIFEHLLDVVDPVLLSLHLGSSLRATTLSEVWQSARMFLLLRTGGIVALVVRILAVQGRHERGMCHLDRSLLYQRVRNVFLLRGGQALAERLADDRDRVTLV